MSKPINNHRPSALEEQAYAEVTQSFTELTKQFGRSRDALSKLEGDLPVIAAAANRLDVSQTDSDPRLRQACNGARWCRTAELLDGVALFKRLTPHGPEFAVVEFLALRSGETAEILASGPDALEVLRTFTRDQRETLRIWTEDVVAQVKEVLAEKYPGQDLSRVADAFRTKLALTTSQTQTDDQQQTRGRRMRI